MPTSSPAPWKRTPSSETGEPAGEEARFEDLLTINEIAAVMRVSKMTAYRLVHGGRLPALRLGNSFRVYRSDLDAYLRASYLPRPEPDTGPDSSQAG